MSKNSEIVGNREILFVIETIAQEKDIPVDSVVKVLEINSVKLKVKKVED